MGLFPKIAGTLSAIFGVGGNSGAALKNNAGVLEIKTGDDTAFATLRAKQLQAAAGINDLPTKLDLLGNCPNIEFSFSGASAPSAGVNGGKFGICHTDGGAYNAGDVVYDSTTALVKVYDVRRLTTSTAITGTISFIANGYYAKEGSSWVLKGDGTGVSTGIERVIELAYTYSSTTVDSTTSIPSGARITRVENVVQTAFNGTSPTLGLTVNGSTPVTLLATTDSDLKTTNQYETMELKDIIAANAGVVRAVVTSSGSTVGAGKVLVFFATPLS